MIQTLFVTATGTDVGKTYVACGLLKALVRRRTGIDVFKPVMSGFDGGEDSDAGRLLRAMGRSLIDLDRVAPLKFRAALAPPSAARAEGKRIELAQLVDLCRTAMAAGPLIIEGAGGVMSPIAEDGTNLDLMAELGAPALLVTGSYLGAVSHTLSALEVLKARGVPVAAVIISQSPGENPPLSEMEDGLSRFAGSIPRFVGRRAQEFDATALCTALYGAA